MHKKGETSKLTPSWAEVNSNLKAVTGSKQKHMVISSLSGLALAFGYPLKWASTAKRIVDFLKIMCWMML